MHAKGELLLRRAGELAARFKSHNLRDFVARRAADRLRAMEALPVEARPAALEGLVRFLDTAERQLPLQNAYCTEQSVLDEQP